VEILFEVYGFTFLLVNKTKQELVIYVPDCDAILKNTKMPLKILSLSTCSVSKTSISTSLEYLNFFDVEISDGEIGEVLTNMKTLRHAFLDLPNNTIDVAEIPKSLQTLALGGIKLTKNDTTTNTVLPELETLSLGFNQISHDVYGNFRKIFPRLQQATAIGQQVANYKFLETCFDSRISSIIVEEFDRNATNSKELEEILIRLDISSTVMNFMLMLPTHGENYVGFQLTEPMVHVYRYNLLGWYKFLSVPAYSKARKYAIII
jgi:hypothetical protein